VEACRCASHRPPPPHPPPQRPRPRAPRASRIRPPPSIQVVAALFDPPPFDPAKLSVRLLPGAADGADARPGPPAPPPPRRRYTLTHNDLTGELTLSIGAEYNRAQLGGWWTRLLRDEVLAEWRAGAGGAPGGRAARAFSSASAYASTSAATSASTSSDDSAAALHVYCHVSGEEGWVAPPALRSVIFQREMTLVLDAIVHAEAALLAARPALAAAPVVVHLGSADAALNRRVAWGALGDRASWRRPGGGGALGLLLRALAPPPPDGGDAPAAAPLELDPGAEGDWGGDAPPVRLEAAPVDAGRREELRR
jgi:hypothetical protein